jgi:hypothetical protein
MKGARARHHGLLHGAIESNSGHVFQIVGDAFCAVPAAPAGLRRVGLEA